MMGINVGRILKFKFEVLSILVVVIELQQNGRGSH